MKNYTKSLITLLLIVSACSLTASPFTFIGERYSWLQGGVVKPGDSNIRNIDRNILNFTTGINAPITADYDVHSSIQYMDLSGSRDTSMLAFRMGVTYHFLPSLGEDAMSGLDPFVRMSVGWEFSDAESGLNDWRFRDGDDYIAEIAVGGQILITSDVAIVSSVGYERIGDNDDIVMGIGLNMTISEPIFVSANVAYRFEDEDVELNSGLGYKF